MTITEAEEAVSHAPLGSRAVTLIRIAREFKGNNERTVLSRAARHSGLGQAEIEAAFAVADRG